MTTLEILNNLFFAIAIGGPSLGILVVLVALTFNIPGNKVSPLLMKIGGTTLALVLIVFTLLLITAFDNKKEHKQERECLIYKEVGETEDECSKYHEPLDCLKALRDRLNNDNF